MTSPRLMSSSSRERQRHRLAGAGTCQVAVGGDDARDRRAPARRQRHDFVARLHRTGRDGAGKAAEILVRAG